MKIVIFYAPAGFGHRKAAEAICENLLDSGCSKESVKVIDAVSLTLPAFKRSYGKVYYYLATFFPPVWGFFYNLLDNKIVCTLLHPLRHLFNWFESFKLRRYVIKEQPDVIICTHFFSAEVMGSLKVKGKIHAQLITVVTDFSLHSYWVNPGTDDYAVMAPTTKDEIAQWGVPPQHIHVTGIPIMKKFLKPQDRVALIKKYELTENVFTILMTSGSFGIGPTVKIIKNLERFSDKVQCIVVCGNNKQLYNDLSQQQFKLKVKVLGFVDTMEELMSIADLMIAKPGGITTCESLVKGLAMIISCPIPGQEAGNAKFLIRHKAAYQITRPEQIVPLVGEVLEKPDKLNEVRKNIRQVAKPNAAQDVVGLIGHKS